MREAFVIIVIWLFTLGLLAVIIGEIRFRNTKIAKQKKANQINKLDIGDVVDKDFESLSIECPQYDFVPTYNLSKRGSWRMAQDKVLGNEIFIQMKAIEYNKFL